MSLSARGQSRNGNAAATGGRPYPNRTSMETTSGLYLDLSDPDPQSVRLEDISHALATINRYTGHARRPISVAEHALIVADRLRSQGHDAAVILAGLHHDDHEAYTGDIGRPMKNAVRALQAGLLEQIEWRVDAVIFEALRLPVFPADMAQVKEADEWALSAESYYLMPSRGRHWQQGGLYDPGEPQVDGDFPLSSVMRLAGPPLPWETVEAQWLAWHHLYLARANGIT